MTDAILFAGQVALGLFCTLMAWGKTAKFVSKQSKKIKEAKEAGVELPDLPTREKWMNLAGLLIVLFLWAIGPYLVITAF